MLMYVDYLILLLRILNELEQWLFVKVNNRKEKKG